MDRRLYLTALAGVLLPACTGRQQPSSVSADNPNESDGSAIRQPTDPAPVRSRDGLFDALDDATGGDTVVLSADADIDLAGEWGIEVPPGVVLRGSRERDGADGAAVHSPPGDEAPRNQDIQEKFVLREGARLSGVRVLGHHHEYVNPEEAHGGDFYAHRGGGVRAGPGTVVDNCEIAGWPYTAVLAKGNAHIHHNHIHHNTWEGLGYGVAIPPGDHMPVIEFNDFNYNRHAISGGGGPQVGFVAQYNVVRPDWVGSQFDMHGSNGLTGTAGRRIEIHNNTFQATRAVQAKTRNPGGEYPAIHVRGTPTEGVWVSQNWFYHESQDSAFRQPEGPTRAHFSDNHYGQNTPERFTIGAPRSHQSPPDPS